jgi:hypothetical protein
VWFLIGEAIWQATGKPISESFGIAFALLWGFVFVWFLATWLLGRQASGQTLLDCGPHPCKKLCLFEAVLFLILGLAGGLKVFGVAGPVFGVSFSVYWLFMAGGRLQVRENGVWTYAGLLRWDKIKSYHWAEDCTLLIRARSPFSFLFRGALPVPPEYKDAFNELLQKHCAVSPVT